ncbi:methyltransferase-like protein [Dinothrombium tinctorium]|uniref:Acetylserotonin O-methyltransferase n=1 Tax=Dinothrombium tinctorium TaxID=1965070 RepID=A0A443QE83_9ACAR|nr:methyltransferase-like protein [Dinothrombium tinctorium]
MSENFAILNRYIYDSLRTEIVCHAVKLNIVDHLIRKPMSADDLAHIIQAHPQLLNRMLRYLVLFGILEENDEIFSVTSLGLLLSDGHEEGMKERFIICSNYSFKVVKHLDHTIRTGGTALELALGMPVFDYLKEHPEDKECFMRMLNKQSKIEARQILSVYDFSCFEHIVDIGGADGTLLIIILKSTPKVRGTVFDLPHIVEKAAEMIAENKLGERCKTTAGNFFDSITVEGDCYLVKYVLHDWNDEKCIQILRNIGKRMDRKSKLLILEKILLSDDYFLQMDDFMLWIEADGKERNISEFQALLRSAGFKMSRLIQMPTTKFTIIETVLSK